MATNGSSASGVVAGGSMSAGGGSKVNKNAPGSRTDIAWKYGVSIDGNPRKLKCKFCEKVITGGVYRLKHHLAGTQKDVGACRAVSEEVKKQMLGIVCSLQQALLKKSIDYVEASTNEDVGDAEKGKRQAEVGIGGHGNIFKKRGVSSQATINNIFKKELREEACQEISSFFYNNAIPFNVAKSSEYQKMFELVARHGQGFKPPSYHEIRVKYLKQKVEHTTEALELHKAHWKETGCSIMTDGWTDKRRRTMLNFLVNSSMGTVFLKSVDASHISKTAKKIFQMLDEVVEEIGEENIVQVVTDNAANYKAAGEMLMEKRKRLYWTPCAAHCIDLMLEDFEKKIPVHKETIASGKKITAYILKNPSHFIVATMHQWERFSETSCDSLCHSLLEFRMPK